MSGGNLPFLAEATSEETLETEVKCKLPKK